MNDAPRATLEKLGKKEQGMRVDFYWLGDRFGHTISLVRGDEAQVVWRSVDDSMHGSVYQELHEQTTDQGGKIIFLNGSGSGAHWSASVEFEQKKCILQFDVASRVAAEPVERIVEYHGDFEEKPAILCGAMDGVGIAHPQEVPPVMTFKSTASDDKLPTTLRFKYSFF